MFVGTITGHVNGGRGPIVGAHIFLFAAGTTGTAGPGIAASTANLVAPYGAYPVNRP